MSRGPEFKLTHYPPLLGLVCCREDETARKEPLLDKLVAAYPDFLARMRATACVGRTAPICPSTTASLPRGPRRRASVPPGVDVDPGRVRYEPFFAKIASLTAMAG